MKKIVLSLLLLSLPTIAGTLWPAEHTTCLNANNPEIRATACPEGKELYVDGENRCGCLDTKEYTPAEICMVALIRCPVEETFSTLFRAGEMCGRSSVGCGCFATEGGVHITSVGDVQ